MGRIAGRPRTAVALGVGCALVTLSWTLFTAPANAVSPPTPWNGVNPFRCTIQDAGQGTTVPDPGADPYCVRFDKTNQNVSELGLVDFLTKEPARFGAAAPKCFYYQEDHWRGSVIQSDQQTVVYEFLGHYFFNKATGDGGVWVTGFSIAGRTFDPRILPGFPPQYDAYYGPGTGGFVTHDDVPVDPGCAATAQQSPKSIYLTPRCLHSGGRATSRALGPVRLGLTESAVRSTLGPPQSLKRNYLRYCVSSGGSLLVGHRIGANRSSAPTVIVMTTSGRFAAHAPNGATIGVGASQKAVKRAFPRTRPELRIGRTAFVQIDPLTVAARRKRAGTVILGIVAGRVRYLAIYNPAVIHSDRMLVTYLRRGL